MEELQQLREQINNLIYHLNDKEGYSLYRAISKNKKSISQFEPEDQLVFIKLEFLIIPFLSTQEIAKLLKDNLLVGLSIEDLDLSERIKKKLIFTDLRDRDALKNALKNALVSSSVEITDSISVSADKKIRTISDWIKDYQSNVSKSRDSLKDAEYFQKKYLNDLPENDLKILKRLLGLYKFLSISSYTPEGFEDDLLLIDESGRLITTNKGKVTVLYDPDSNEKKGSINNSKENSEVDKLQQEIDKYPEGSIERKALEDELVNLQEKS